MSRFRDSSVFWVWRMLCGLHVEFTAIFENFSVFMEQFFVIFEVPFISQFSQHSAAVFGRLVDAPMGQTSQHSMSRRPVRFVLPDLIILPERISVEAVALRCGVRLLQCN